MADALDRRGRKKRPKPDVIERCQIGQGGGAQIIPRLQFRLARGGGELVPGTDGKAVIAPIDAIAHRLAELERDRSLMLDIEVAEAPPRIELERCRKRVSGTHVEAARTGAAALLMRRFEGQLGARKDGAEEQPGAELATD